MSRPMMFYIKFLDRKETITNNDRNETKIKETMIKTTS